MIKDDISCRNHFELVLTPRQASTKHKAYIAPCPHPTSDNTITFLSLSPDGKN